MTAVILDTDIGTDIDDTWALAMLLRCPELDLRLVTTVTGDTTYRARIVAGVLTAASRDEVPIGIGVPTRLPDGLPSQPQADFARHVRLDLYRSAVHADGVSALVDCIMRSDEVMTVITIGPMTNIAAALSREPRIADKARLIAMLGSVHGVGSFPSIFDPAGQGVIAEWNVRSDVPSCRTVFEAHWEKTVAPLDTCGDVVLHGARYRKLRESSSPLVYALLVNYEAWYKSWAAAGSPWSDSLRVLEEHFHDGPAGVPFWECSSSVLFDTVAIYLAYDESLLNMEKLPISLDHSGLMAVEQGAPELRLATSWRDRDRFEDLLVERLTTVGMP